MRIGILTYHSQINYGGVLQAYALQEVLRALGHDVKILDRWFTSDNRILKGLFSGFSIFAWVKFLAGALAGNRRVGMLVRHLRTMCFVRSHYLLTPFHFVEWKELANVDLGVDVVVVGSDQVWSNGFQKPHVYLLKGAPMDIPAISYAASFGMHALPAEYRQDYIEGFRRLSYISVREKEGRSLVEKEGFKAVYVADPVFLAGEKFWRAFVRANPMDDTMLTGRVLVCYLIHQDMNNVFPILDRYARKCKGLRVVVFWGGGDPSFPQNIKSLCKCMCLRIRCVLSPVRIYSSAGPKEFVAGFAHAEMIVTDSFHAMVFAAVFKKKARVLAPHDGATTRAFARLGDFISEFVTGNIVVPNIESAIESLSDVQNVGYRLEKMEDFRESSLKWLKEALTKIKG